MPARMIHEAWTKDEGATYFITVDGKWDVRTPSVGQVRRLCSNIRLIWEQNTAGR